ncbi:class I histocompatibility antigen, F10 alpha chain-like [Alligator sinensis]|uniref:Class I histocompatibility antigen, F10 alpha chain-like n=1 Tax=Alligator sinensis TaxID=38654 RepID=A0A3Q0FR74_ALLSI|nr:class I histocompatibility antigen, F10 alpha chain-like [Alligator sinensis]
MPGGGWAAWATGLTLAPTGAGVEESHSLSYHYTATYDAGGLREFWAAGALDGAPIDRYDRAARAKLPAQPWMRDGLEPDYWRQGGISRAAKEAWFNDAVATLQRRTNRSQGTLQWQHGCMVEPGGLVRGWYQFAYDGADFLLFDTDNERWLASSRWAEVTQRRWSAQPDFSRHVQRYLTDACVEWLGRFLHSRRAWVSRHAAPQVQVWSHPAREQPGWLALTCLAGGFPTAAVKLGWHQGNTTLKGVLAGLGALPAGDGNFQRRGQLLVPAEQAQGVRCQASHGDLAAPLEAAWEPPAPSIASVSPWAVAGLMLVGVLVLGVALLLWKRRASRNDTSSMDSLVSDPVNSGAS